MKKLIALFSVIGISVSVASYAESPKVIEVAVTDDGFTPSSIKTEAGKETTLRVTRKVKETCATKVQVANKGKAIDLPLNKPVDIKLGKLAKGEIKFGCGMEMMMSAVIIAE